MTVQITEGVKFFTHGGGWVFREKYPHFDSFGKIEIGNNVYIGNSAIILPGIKIENDCIVGAGSVVTKSIPKGYVVGGNPAVIIGTISEVMEKQLKYNLDTKKMNELEKKKYLLNLEENRFIRKGFYKI